LFSGAWQSLDDADDELALGVDGDPVVGGGDEDGDNDASSSPQRFVFVMASIGDVKVRYDEWMIARKPK
jgi:hypothetical protein